MCLNKYHTVNFTLLVIRYVSLQTQLLYSLYDCNDVITARFRFVYVLYNLYHDS